MEIEITVVEEGYKNKKVKLWPGDTLDLVNPDQTTPIQLRYVALFKDVPKVTIVANAKK